VSDASVRPLERPEPRVAFQGEPGAYSEDAVHRFFGRCEAKPLPTVRTVFEQAEIGAVDFGVVPLENSQAGSINETYDLLVRHGVKLVGEVVIRVDHALLGVPGASLSDITRVLSHPQALAQCEEFLATLEAEVVPYHDTAGAAKRVAEEGRRDQAAVAGRRAAELYGLQVLTEAIQTFPENFTKFGVIGTGPPPRTEAPDKTSIVFAVADVPGSLHRCLGGFADQGINLVKIESRPQGGRPWRYLMYLDFEAGADEPSAQGALRELSAHTSFVRILGSYPAWRD
jgi:prephenate dehydratase